MVSKPAELLLGIPELGGFGEQLPPVRIPESGSIPTTRRLRNLIDTDVVQRLRKIKQLGPLSLVYPGGIHSRFEHSLGTYAMARKMLLQLLTNYAGGLVEEEFPLDEGDVRAFLVAALLHDIGHYPFSHVLEEIPAVGEFDIIHHEKRAREMIAGSKDLQRVLWEQWGLDPERIARIIDESVTPENIKDRRLWEMLSGPLNPDRLDYLMRDSSHVGVPYGKAIDLDRLLGSLVFGPSGLAVTSKGISAAETLMFASYLMYREVYWHHTSRAGTAMLKRAVSEAVLHEEISLGELLRLNDEQAISQLLQCKNPVTRDLIMRLEGPGRRLYKRVVTKDILEGWYLELANASYWEQLELLRDVTKRAGIAEHLLLVDMAGPGKQLFFSVPVIQDGSYQNTADPEVSILAPYVSKNFHEHAKRLYLLAPAEVVERVRKVL